MEDFDVRAALLIGRDRAVAWDTLAHPAQMAGVRTAAAELRHPSAPAFQAAPIPLTVVYSHADWDHAWGTCALGEVEAVVAQAHAAERFRTDVPAELQARRGREPGAWDAVHLVPPTVVFDHTLTLDMGGATLELHALPGHTPDCIVGFVPEWGVLLAGDTVETPLPVVNDGAAVRGWAEELARWLADGRITTVVPSHGRVGGAELLEDTLRYLQGLGAGKGPSNLAALTPFYRETHRRNLQLVGADPTGGS